MEIGEATAHTGESQAVSLIWHQFTSPKLLSTLPTKRTVSASPSMLSHPSLPLQSRVKQSFIGPICQPRGDLPTKKCSSEKAGTLGSIIGRKKCLDLPLHCRPKIACSNKQANSSSSYNLVEPFKDFLSEISTEGAEILSKAETLARKTINEDNSRPADSSDKLKSLLTTKISNPIVMNSSTYKHITNSPKRTTVPLRSALMSSSFNKLPHTNSKTQQKKVSFSANMVCIFFNSP